MDELSRLPLDDLIPHRPPARLVERVLEATDEYAAAELTVREGPWLVSGALAPAGLVEALAQTTAIYAGGRARRGGEPPRPGYLAAISLFEFPSPALAGEVVRLEVRLEKIFGDLAAFKGEARVGERIVAHGRLRVALVPASRT